LPVVLVVFAALLAAFAWRGPSTLGAPDIPQIPEIRSRDGVAAVTLRAALDAQGRPAFFWRGQEIAPTIRVRPGDEIRVHYTNALPQFCGLGMTSDSNLHFHGLRTSPKPPGDDVVTTLVAPSRSYDYVVRIGRTQSPGLYWYHPHPHHLANWELGNGMAGAIVVEGVADVYPELRGLRERVIVLRDMPRDPSVAAAENPSVLGAVPAPAKHAAFAQPLDGDDFQGATPCGVESDAQPTINGLPSVSIPIAPGERQLWRVLNASGRRHFDLTFAGAMKLVALDGVVTRARTIGHALLPPGARAEIVVTGPEHPQLLLSRCYDAGRAGEPNPGVIFGELVDDRGLGAATRVAPPFGLRLTHTEPAEPSVRRTVRFTEDRRGFSLNGRRFVPGAAPMFVARAGTTEEWTLVNDTDEVHVFHVHQVHFLVEASSEWHDVIDVPPHRKLEILVDFRDPIVRGTFFFHCHLTDHEDGGMMATIKVV